MATLELPYEKVYDLLHKCCTSISPDVLYLMKRAAAKETNPEAKTFLETMLKNVELAGQQFFESILLYTKKQILPMLRGH